MVIAVHGGAGSPRDGRVRAEEDCHAALDQALAAGRTVLEGGGPALDAVEAAVLVLEDFPRFNAGRGAVPNVDGKIELAACVMEGRSGLAGACADVTRVRHPVSLARTVMEKTRHVLIVGPGAERLAEEHGLAMEDPEWFVTPNKGTDHGTVGAVALDGSGGLAAATSTGGVLTQMAGRVGDAPVIGAGTYANAACAISCTGIGETFIRAVAAHDIAARMEYRGDDLAAAAAAVIPRVDGGLIAVDTSGNVVLPFNTALMYRGVWREGQEAQTAIWGDTAAVDG
jgi:beta-aspartyl-peptidase (threonine type)